MGSVSLLAGSLLLFALGCALPGTSETRMVQAREASAESLEVRLWRAGRSIPPGLSSGRVVELEGERARAVERLGREISRADEAQLARWFASPETPDELWCAAARAITALERYDLAPFLCEGLDPARGARRNTITRTCLHALYGRWFRSRDEVAPYMASVVGGEGTRLLLETCRWEEARSRERLLAELAHDPTGASAWLADPDPLVRSGAARILARLFQREGENSKETLEILISHLEGEYEPRAFREGLDACFAPLERASVDDPASGRLRALLVSIARQEGESRTLSAAQALARIPWRAEGARDLGHYLSGVEALGAMMRGLATTDRRRGVNDPDPLVAVLSALHQLCDQASAAGLGTELRSSSARTSLFDVLDDSLQDEAVRAAAAAAAGPLARMSDGPRLAAVLEDPAVGAQVKHALLGALSTILFELGPGSPGAGELLAAVADQTGAEDSDLRRRALALCAEPGLEPLVRSLDPSFLVSRLDHEEGREATLDLLRLVQRFGHAGMVPGLLDLERFDALCSEPSTLEPLASGLRQLSAGSGPAAMAAAARLVAALAEETRLARQRHALAFVAALDAEAVLELSTDDHRAIVAWVWRVVGAGIAPHDLTPTGVAFERRLLDVHLPRAEIDDAVAGIDPFEGAHLSALLRADLFLTAAGEARNGSKPQVEAAFESAIGMSTKPELRLLVLRDRARFRAAANEGVKAMGDYRRLFDAGSEADVLIGIPDLRSAVELLGRLDQTGAKGRSATADEACQLLGRLISREAWRSEPASVRMQDLRDWVRTALASDEAENLRRVDAALADLPLTQIETQEERHPAPLWFGLTREAGWFQELLDLRVRARLGLRALEARG